MFVSYNYKHDRSVFGSSYLEITDSDFTALKKIEYRLDALDEVFGFVIDTYEKKNLPVAVNIFRAAIYVCRDMPSKIGRVLASEYRAVPALSKYKDDIAKYMVLL